MMASQGHQKLRKNPSPSFVKQGPLKATKPYVLKPSPSASPTIQWSYDSHKKSRRSPDHRSSPDRPFSPGNKAEKNKLRFGSTGVHQIKRTNSVEAITSQYMKGEWPKEPVVSFMSSTTLHSSGNLAPSLLDTCDKYTQTDDDWDEQPEQKSKAPSHKRSSSLGNDGKIKEKYKARLAKNKEGSKNSQSNQIRISPVQGHHYGGHGNPPTKAVAIQHIPKSPFKIVGSLESVNQEIEGINLASISSTGDRSCRNNMMEIVTPDGHRAPVLELLHPETRNVNTQTPSGNREHLLLRSVEGSDLNDSHSGGSHSSSRSMSESPNTQPIIPGTGQLQESPLSGSCLDGLVKLTVNDKEAEGDSPKPSNFVFVREPPDGCEKIKTFDDTQRRSSLEKSELPVFSPIKKPLENCNIPSRSSAFCSLMGTYGPLNSGGS